MITYYVHRDTADENANDETRATSHETPHPDRRRGRSRGPDRGRRGTVLDVTKSAHGANSVSLLIVDGLDGGKRGTYVASNLEPWAGA